MGFENQELLDKLATSNAQWSCPCSTDPFPASQARKPRLPPLQDRGPGFKLRCLLSLLPFVQKTQTVSALQRPQITGVTWGQSQCHNLAGSCQLWGSPSPTPRCHPQSDHLARELPTATAIFPSSPRGQDVVWAAPVIVASSFAFHFHVASLDRTIPSQASSPRAWHRENNAGLAVLTSWVQMLFL